MTPDRPAHGLELSGATRRDIVLVVDDSPETLGFLNEALEGAGISVLVAVDGESALALMEQITPDLVLMDAVMPGIDGFETCRRLKRTAHLAHLPVIFMTGLAETEHILRGFQAGGVDYVAKPIVTDELMARMRAHLANARLTQSAHVALDAAGRYLIALDPDGRLKWYTPQAARLLAVAFPDFEDTGFTLPSHVAAWLALQQASAKPPPSVTIVSGELTLELSCLGRIGSDEYLVRLSEVSKISEDGFLRDRLGITIREAEVLLWLARGKANRDISDILGISPRTVNKHLEQIYAKLGVENRASAAGIAVRALEARTR